LLRVGEAERRAMIGRLAPRITLEDDGSHWYRTWLMLRDSLVHFPWYARDRGSLRRQPLDIDAYQLHAWTCDVMRQWNAYQQLVDAVLGWNSQAAIAAARDKIVIAVDPLHALHAADAAWAGSTIPSVILPADAVARARLLASTWT
jgi:hypothetical protein